MSVHESNIRFGVQLPTVDGLRTGDFPVAEAAREAEALGFDGVWIGDHLVLKVPVIDSVVAAAIAATVTSRVSIGFGVLVAPLRQPAWLVKQLSSLQFISSDRLEIGLGVGGEFPVEWDAAGVPASERGKRMDVFVDALSSMLSGVPAELGPPLNVRIPPLSPHGQSPPLWVGGRTEKAMARAARCGGWIGVWLDGRKIRAARDQLIEFAERLGRPEPPIAVQILVNPNPDERAGRDEMRRYMKGIYDIPFDRIERFVAAGPLPAIAEQISDLVRAGARSVVLMHASERPVADYEAFAEIASLVRSEIGPSQEAG